MAEMWINMGPQHPMTHGLWNLRVKVDGETIIDAVPEIGYLHRGVEKLAENRTYQQLVALADRVFCYGAGFSWSALYLQTVEELMGVKVPERAQYIRVILLEIQRIASHLMWLAAYAADLGLLTMFLYPMRERELFLDLMQMVTGGRLTYVYPRIGGVHHDLPPKFQHETIKVLEWFEKRLDEYEAMLDDSDVFLLRTMDVGKLRAEDAKRLGVTGPNLRGSNVTFDMRRAHPYLVYDELDFCICVEKEGDCYARYKVRMNEMRESCNIIRAALKKLPRGEIMASRVPRTATGERLVRNEDPRGESAMYIVGDGTNRPYRLKVRSPAFVNISATPHFLIGCKIADVPAIYGSIDVCMGETDR